MEFQQVVQQRRMVRRFASTPIGAIAVGHPATQEGREAQWPDGNANPWKMWCIMVAGPERL